TFLTYIHTRRSSELFSDHIVISYHEPTAVAGQGYLHINNVTHGYRNAFLEGIIGEEKGAFGNSAACNVNVNCPEGLPYGIQKRRSEEHTSELQSREH